MNLQILGIFADYAASVIARDNRRALILPSLVEKQVAIGTVRGRGFRPISGIVRTLLVAAPVAAGPFWVGDS